MRAVNTFCVRKPGSMVLSFVTLLIMRPLATSRPQLSAISKTTSARLMLPIFRLDEPRFSSLSTSLMSDLDAWIAGMAPEKSVATIESATTNARTGG